MTRKEAIRQTDQENTLIALGFTREEAGSLRRISMTLQRWHELECGTGDGQTSISVERDGDEPTSKPYKRIQYPTPHGYVDRRYPIADRETGARRRLAAIIAARNARILAERAVCPNCEQWQHAGNTGDCCHECVKRGFAPSRLLAAYVQGDPRGAALYIIRPGDVPAGADANSYYTRGIVVY